MMPIHPLHYVISLPDIIQVMHLILQAHKCRGMYSLFAENLPLVEDQLCQVA